MPTSQPVSSEPVDYNAIRADVESVAVIGELPGDYIEQTHRARQVARKLAAHCERLMTHAILLEESAVIRELDCGHASELGAMRVERDKLKVEVELWREAEVRGETLADDLRRAEEAYENLVDERDKYRGALKQVAALLVFESPTASNPARYGNPHQLKRYIESILNPEVSEHAASTVD